MIGRRQFCGLGSPGKQPLAAQKCKQWQQRTKLEGGRLHGRIKARELGALNRNAGLTNVCRDKFPTAALRAGPPIIGFGAYLRHDFGNVDPR